MSRNIYKQRGGRNSSKLEDWYCDYCQRSGHTADKCWHKFEKPDWAKQLANPSITEPIPTTSTSTSASTVTLSHKDFEQLLKMEHGDSAIPSASYASAGNSACDRSVSPAGWLTLVEQIIWQVTVVCFPHILHFLNLFVYHWLMEAKLLLLVRDRFIHHQYLMSYLFPLFQPVCYLFLNCANLKL